MPQTDEASDLTTCESEKVLVAAVIHPKGSGVDRLLEAFVSDLMRDGIKVRGLIQRNHGIGCQARMELMDLDSGEVFKISQDLGPGSVACRLNPDGIASASIALRKALDKPTDLLIANRFGSMELKGRGLADEMLAAMCAGIPLITSVTTPYLEGWRQFTGRLGDELSAESRDIVTWWQRVTEQCPTPVQDIEDRCGENNFIGKPKHGLVQAQIMQL
jgi:nucleoside-triphosphatase THEP1